MQLTIRVSAVLAWDNDRLNFVQHLTLRRHESTDTTGSNRIKSYPPLLDLHLDALLDSTVGRARGQTAGKGVQR